LPLRFDDIGNRLKAFRLGSGLSAEEVAKRIGISRTALYRFEKGEVVKIDTLEKLAELLQVSLPTLLGVGVEYIASAVTYFERMRQIEETAEHIIVLAGPISYLLASDAFNAILGQLLKESIPENVDDRARADAEVDEIMAVLTQRKETYRRRQPAVVNLIAASEISRFLINGMVGRLDLPKNCAPPLRPFARRHSRIMEDRPLACRSGLCPKPAAHRLSDIPVNPTANCNPYEPFRLGEGPNVRVGVAMITSAPGALALHLHRAAEGMWHRAQRGAAAGLHLRGLIARPGNERRQGKSVKVEPAHHLRCRMTGNSCATYGKRGRIRWPAEPCA
jgi:transcriptional regulator with XRE-family HTH domain